MNVVCCHYKRFDSSNDWFHHVIAITALFYNLPPMTSLGICKPHYFSRLHRQKLSMFSCIFEKR